MLQLRHITTADSRLYSYMEQLLVASFPPEEYRPLEELRRYSDGKASFRNNVILHNNVPIGLLTYWDFHAFCYIEHFAIDPSLRNGGYGKAALQHLCQLLPDMPIVLEVEEPLTEMAQRRIRFYQHQDFTLWEKEYLQPPYKPGDGCLPMRLMAYGNLACGQDFEHVRTTIYREVYKAV